MEKRARSFEKLKKLKIFVPNVRTMVKMFLGVVFTRNLSQKKLGKVSNIIGEKIAFFQNF